MDRDVPTSVMPKGVEHESLGVEQSPTLIVPTSVMPKGVEHRRDAATIAGVRMRADLSDAERR